MSEFPARSLVVTLPLAIYEALEALAAEVAASVEDLAASLLADVVRYGAPGELRAAARLAAQAADLLADRWQRRRAEIAQVRAVLRRIDAVLGRLSQGA
ncbi:MAG: hypothetical protein HGA45_11965 [Chloroflexales bacterium]|nr:hypothetical protein [Chloroflexales bacterium]